MAARVVAAAAPAPVADNPETENVKLFPKVKALDKLPLLEGPPMMQVPSEAIHYELSTLEYTDFKDRIAFEKSNFTDETKQLEDLTEVLNRGDRFVSLLYTYRSCSKAMPMITDEKTEEKLRQEIHRRSFDILRPEVLKLKELMDFHEQAIALIRHNILGLVKPEQAGQVHNEEILDALVKVIDMLVVLDALKDRKACLLNDFARYKRAFSPIRGELPESDRLADEINNLQMFLSNPKQPHNYIVQHLKTEIQKLIGYDLVLNLMLNHCADALEAKRFILPDEEFTFYRAIPHMVYILDSEDKKSGINAFRAKNVKLDRYKKLYKAFPVIPLYGDMQITVQEVLRRCTHWEEDMLEEWSTARPQKLKDRYELVHYLDDVRKVYTDITSDFTALLNEIKAYMVSAKFITPVMLKRVFDVVLRSFRALASWSSKIKEQSAYKYSNPCRDDEYKRLGGKGSPGHEYEKVVRFNYTPEEMSALLDVIGMIKGLGGLMMRSELLCVPLVRRYIHDEVQIFLQQEVARPLRKAHKRKRPIKVTLLQMRDIGCDWIDRATQHKDYEQKKKVLVQVNRDFPRRATAPTLTQITLIRRMMHSVYDAKAPGMKGGVFTKKDLKPENVDIWKRFYDESFFYKYLLDYSASIRQVTDLSHLWYREFYLEMTKCVQFPIGMSMPWIMTEFLVNTPSMKENIFFPMDIYNDAAARALTVLKQQFLFDEIEAEANLSFDQLIFHLSEDIFKHFKTVASAVLIDKPYAKHFQDIKKKQVLQLQNSRYITLMAQRHIQLLGRTIDLSLLISQHVNGYLRRNLDYVIRKFESSDLSSIVELQYHLQNIKMTHELLADHLNLDPFDEMFKELNDDNALGQFRGRIVFHVFSELLSDLLPNFVYNSATRRFVRGPENGTPPPERPSPPKGVNTYFWYGRGYKEAFDRLTAIYRGYFGLEHFEALLGVLDFTEVPLIIHECVNEAENKILYDFAPYVEALKAAIQPMKLHMQYGVMGGYLGFEALLRYIGQYGSLRSGVFQCLREIGNTLLFIQQLESVMTKMEDVNFQLHAFFLGIQPHPPRGPHLPPPTEAQELPFVLPAEGKEAPFLLVLRSICAEVSRLKPADSALMEQTIRAGEQALRQLAWRKEKHSLFSATLAQLGDTIDKNLRRDWQGPAPENGVLNPDSSKDIVRLFSCLQFLYCQQPETPGTMNDIETFGDGFSWAGCTLIHLMGFRPRFELLDFTYHVIKLMEVKPISLDVVVTKGGKESKEAPKMSEMDKKMAPIVKAFLFNAYWIKDRNQEIFTCLDSYFTPTTARLLALRPPSTVMDEKSGMILAGAQTPRASVSVARAGSIVPGTPGAPPSAAPPRGAPPPGAPPSSPPPPSAPGGPPSSPPPPQAPAAPPMAPPPPGAPPSAPYAAPPFEAPPFAAPPMDGGAHFPPPPDIPMAPDFGDGAPPAPPMDDDGPPPPG